ncbi:hypothetical protein BS47DRAFT_1311575 [Hydnum rufescens UP504]|uniref:Translocation protein sec66 n=1 Tax=Hydnum rufescens UP504 TaxID=1448309 RepID=A0A9P6BAM1_9AGAM|nr:hypothetical protein BS47DRAFT_1311575 [Hydnum rufescens UP504]
MIPVFVPFAFIGIVVGGLGIFSKIYRNRQAARAYEPWFPSHPERDTYITLLQQTDPAPSDALLKAALLRRAVADVTRIFRIRDDKAALTALLQKGSISDDLWANFQAAERELEAEIVEVVTEANTFVEGWGQIIFQSAGEVVQNEKYRDIFANIPKQKTALDAKLGIERPAVGSRSSATLPSIPSISVPNGADATLPIKSPSKRPKRAASSASSANGSPSNGPPSLPPSTPTKQHLELPSPQGGNSKGPAKKKNKRK